MTLSKSTLPHTAMRLRWIRAPCIKSMNHLVHLSIQIRTLVLQALVQTWIRIQISQQAVRILCLDCLSLSFCLGLLLNPGRLLSMMLHQREIRQSESRTNCLFNKGNNYEYTATPE